MRLQQQTKADRERMKEMANLRLGNDLIKKYIEQAHELIRDYEQEYDFFVPGKKEYEIADTFAHSIAGHLVGWHDVSERLTVEQAKHNLVLALAEYYMASGDDGRCDDPRPESDVEAEWAGRRIK